MSIRRVKDGAPKAGEWINKRSILIGGMCGHPHRVSVVTKSRVYYENPEPGEKDRFCSMESVTFICTTEQESKDLWGLSDKCRVEISEAVRSVQAKYKALLEDLIKEST